MSHFFMIPANENGIVLDNYLIDDIQVALAAPFAFSDVFLYSHGWWTDASMAMQDYNRFTIGFAQRALTIANAKPKLSLGGSLGIGIHWPSMLTEDTGSIGSIVNRLEAASFYTMEKRADNIGVNAGYLILRSLFECKSPPQRVNLIGHSFGCKVILSLLQEIAKDGIECPPTVALNVVLLQAATDDNHLEQADIYGAVAGWSRNLRLLVTISHEDLALRVAYPAAHVIDVFRGNQVRQALGVAGPTAKVSNQFGGAKQMAVNAEFARTTITACSGDRLIVADLTGIHRSNPKNADPITGHHSDIFLPEVYDLIAGFVFGV
jgi:hypothetical protein